MPTELWQWLLSVAAATVMVNQVIVIVLGRSRRLRGWFQARWQPSITEHARNDAIDKMIAEFKPNGGSSMRDKVDGISSLLSSHILEAKADHQLLIDHLAKGGDA